MSMKSSQEKNKLGSAGDARRVSGASDKAPAVKRAGRPHRTLSRQDAARGAKPLDRDGAPAAETKVRGVTPKSLKKHPDAALGKPREQKLIRRARP